MGSERTVQSLKDALREELGHRREAVPKTTCRACAGTGLIALPTGAIDALLILRRIGEADAERVMLNLRSLLGDEVEHTAVNNRLERLRREGLVTRRRDGRRWLYAVAQAKRKKAAV